MSISKQLLWERKSGFVYSRLGVASVEPDKVTNSSDVFTKFFSVHGDEKGNKYSQFASWNRNRNWYSLEKIVDSKSETIGEIIRWIRLKSKKNLEKMYTWNFANQILLKIWQCSYVQSNVADCQRSQDKFAHRGFIYKEKKLLWNTKKYIVKLLY